MCRRPGDCDTRCEGTPSGVALPLGLGCTRRQIRTLRFRITFETPRVLQQTPTTHVTIPTSRPSRHTHLACPVYHPPEDSLDCAQGAPTERILRGRDHALAASTAAVLGEQSREGVSVRRRPISALPSCMPAKSGVRLYSAAPPELRVRVGTGIAVSGALALSPSLDISPCPTAAHPFSPLRSASSAPCRQIRTPSANVQAALFSP